MNMKWLIDFLDDKIKEADKEASMGCPCCDQTTKSMHSGRSVAFDEVKDYILACIKVTKDEETN